MRKEPLIKPNLAQKILFFKPFNRDRGVNQEVSQVVWDILCQADPDCVFYDYDPGKKFKNTLKVPYRGKFVSLNLDGTCRFGSIVFEDSPNWVFPVSHEVKLHVNALAVYVQKKEEKDLKKAANRCQEKTLERIRGII